MNEQLRTNIKDTEERIAAIQQELDNAGEFRAGTTWWTDRVREVEHLNVVLTRQKAALK